MQYTNNINSQQYPPMNQQVAPKEQNRVTPQQPLEPEITVMESWIDTSQDIWKNGGASNQQPAQKTNHPGPGPPTKGLFNSVSNVHNPFSVDNQQVANKIIANNSEQLNQAQDNNYTPTQQNTNNHNSQLTKTVNEMIQLVKGNKWSNLPSDIWDVPKPQNSEIPTPKNLTQTPKPNPVRRSAAPDQPTTCLLYTSPSPRD